MTNIIMEAPWRVMAVLVVLWTVWGPSWFFCGPGGSVWAAPPSYHHQGDDDGEVWLTDEIFYDDINVYDKPQGDQAVEQPTELCPPVPATLPDGSCHAQKCSSDKECGESGSRKCCYNGCIYTCLPQLAVPAFLDWIREPRRRISSGLSWLVTGPDEADEAEPCSTTPVEDDADPLLCPEGYFCNIYDEGDAARGVPNQGTCAKLADDVDDDDSEGDAEKKPEDGEDGGRRVAHAHACDMDGRMLLEGHSIQRDGQQCICKSRQLSCEGKKNHDNSDPLDKL